MLVESMEAGLDQRIILYHAAKASFSALPLRNNVYLAIALCDIAPGGDFGHAKT